MNFVQLVENLRVECGVSGSPLVTVQTVSGEMLRLRNWIADAWNEIQVSRQEWKFLRAQFSFNTQANKQQYTLADLSLTNLDMWKQNSFWIYDPAIGIADQMPFNPLPWDDFREMYIRGSQTPQKPQRFALATDDSIWLGPLPDNVYTISGEYWTDPVQLSADLDTPSMPVQFHKLVVYEAMKKFAGYDAATEVYQRAVNEGSHMRTMLEIKQLPPVTIDGGF
jgi:hypothetical protein